MTGSYFAAAIGWFAAGVGIGWPIRRALRIDQQHNKPRERS